MYCWQVLNAGVEHLPDMRCRCIFSRGCIVLQSVHAWHDQCRFRWRCLYKLYGWNVFHGIWPVHLCILFRWNVLDRRGHDPGLDVPFLWLHDQCVHFNGPGGVCGEHDRAEYVHRVRGWNLLCGPGSGVPVVSSWQGPAVDSADLVRGLPCGGVQVHNTRDCMHVLWDGQVQLAARPDECCSMP